MLSGNNNQGTHILHMLLFPLTERPLSSTILLLPLKQAGLVL